MKVWLVNDHHCGDCGEIVGVFDSPAKAQAMIDANPFEVYLMEETEVQ